MGPRTSSSRHYKHETAKKHAQIWGLTRPSGEAENRAIFRRALPLVLAALAPLAPVAHAAEFTATTVQSPANPVAVGTLVTYTTTVTNTSGSPYPGQFNDDVVLDMFLSLYRSDRPPPNQYASVTPSQGTCTRKDTTPPSVDCTLGSLDAGAGATYVSTIAAQVSMENRIAVVRCTSVSDCGTLAVADVDTIVKKSCVVPSVVGRRLASARHVLRKAECAVGTVTRRHARRSRRGRVLSQRPAAGTRLAAGAPVALVVGRR
jgi:hypothetical protein